MYIYLLFVLVVLFLASLRQIDQYERGVMFTMGRYSGTKEPGWRIVIPIFQRMQKVDIRVRAVDVPDQESLTLDNISIKVNAVIYFRVKDASKAIIQVENYFHVMSQLAQTSMRNVVGEVELDELLSKREAVADRIRNIVDAATEPWGIVVESVDLRDIVIPDDMKRTIGKQAESEREKRAVIIKAEGEVASAENMAKAAAMLSAVPGALHLRTLQSINDISSDQSNTVVFVVPLEILRAIENFSKKMENDSKKGS